MKLFVHVLPPDPGRHEIQVPQGARLFGAAADELNGTTINIFGGGDPKAESITRVVMIVGSHGELPDTADFAYLASVDVQLHYAGKVRYHVFAEIDPVVHRVKQQVVADPGRRAPGEKLSATVGAAARRKFQKRDE